VCSGPMGGGPDNSVVRRRPARQHGRVDHGLRLRPPRDDDEVAAVAAHAALLTEDFSFLLDFNPGESWNGYLRRLAERSRGMAVVDGWVPSTFLLAVVGGDLVGRVSIRHELNAQLSVVGGHIGYGVVAAHRRRGHATGILRQALVVARSLGVDRALLTCDDDNTGSATVIERCGGILDSVVAEPGTGTAVRRYWID
jgi:predicted acetyltransferase